MGTGAGDTGASGKRDPRFGRERASRPTGDVATRRPGKRVGGHTYVHRDAVPALAERDRAAVEAAARRLEGHEWNVAKVGRGSVSLLLYEDFDEHAFPALLTSVHLDAATSAPKVTDYSRRANPPILHRKERLLPPDDPRIPRFAALTETAERHGLFRNAHSIGTRQAWQRRIAEAGLILKGHILEPQDGDEPAGARPEWTVPRQKTAIARRELSQPMALMLRFGLVGRADTIMDFGCGLGDDVAALSGAGYDAVGWDPYHRPDGPRRVSDAVNVGFVINVIEEPSERQSVLEEAWALARRVLVVSVMPFGKADVTGMRPFRDGVLTSWGTFQRYFRQEDLRALVAQATGQSPVSLAPGIVAAFRDKELEQEVAYRRRSRAVLIAETIAARPRPPREPARSRPVPADLRERAADEIETVWRRALELGRVPAADDLDGTTKDALARKKVSLKRAIALTTSADFWDEEALRRASAARREDLLVHFALTLFPGAHQYASHPAEIRRDIRAFFGSAAAMMDEARRLLFSLGQPETLRLAVDHAVQSGLGGRIGSAFAFRPSELPRLPAAVRVIVGCAEVLLDDAVSADFARLEVDQPRLALLRSPNPESAWPVIAEEIDVDLGTRRVRRRGGSDRVVYLKSRYMPLDAPGRTQQTNVDSKLLAVGIVTDEAQGPTFAELTRMIRSQSVPRGSG